jgi:ribosomal-protein-alanine N-acetyltransferase
MSHDERTHGPRLQPGFVTARLYLRPATADDLDALHALWSDREVRRYLFDGQPVSRERAEEVLAAHLPEAAEGLGLWLVLGREDGRFIGCAGLYPASLVVEFEPALAGLLEALAALAPSAWGRGYAHEALTALIDYAFGDLAQTRVAGVNDAPNVASERMLRGLGFELLRETPGPHYRQRSHVLTREHWAARARAAARRRTPGAG